MLRYACPDCRATNNLHALDCEFERTAWHDIEKAYVDILSLVIGRTAREEPVTEAALREQVHGEWSGLHERVYRRLVRAKRIEVDDGTVRPVDPDARVDLVDPTREPMRTIWEHGSVSGAHDNAVFALISYFQMRGLSWQQTKAKVLEWYDRTGCWDDDEFEERSPEALVETKEHVYHEEYGWSEKATAAKSVIEARR